MFKIYYNLIKPGIIYGNAITAAAGFFMAAKGHINWFLFLAMLMGLSFVVASACVINNIWDRDIDQRMERTKNRAIVTGTVSKNHAFIFAIILLLLGIVALHHHVNQSALITALVGFLVYVFLYTPLKRRSVHATLVGAIAGAVPPVVGYTAVTNKFDLGALLLFSILVAWQMPHFYSIAIRRLDDYAAAGIPVLPVKKGVRITKINILIYILLFITTTVLLFVFKYSGYFYLTIISLMGLTWLWFGIQGFKTNIDDKAWARKMFLLSLIIILVFSITVSIDAIINK
ncbi:MAG TPA: heme o synthase [Patescibacteria group bacterium]